MINFALGFVAALVAIQFYPPIANIGVWIVKKGKDVLGGNG